VSEQQTSETVSFRPKQPLWYTSGKYRTRAEFVKMSASGKRAYIWYGKNDLSGGWSGAGFVHPENLEPRDE
jgi:hypothetical protein